jgi:DNA-directed RNA polymerases I and III subunit RPAC2
LPKVKEKTIGTKGAMAPKGKKKTVAAPSSQAQEAPEVSSQQQQDAQMVDAPPTEGEQAGAADAMIDDDEEEEEEEEEEDVKRVNIVSLGPRMGPRQMANKILTRRASKQLPGSEDTAASFEFINEGHTLGNALRWVVMKKYVSSSRCTLTAVTNHSCSSRSPDVELCAYTIPHPSEAKMHVRIQTYGKSSPEASLSCSTTDSESRGTCHRRSPKGTERFGIHVRRYS